MLSSCPVCLKVYLALLNHPLDQWRITHQELYVEKSIHGLIVDANCRSGKEIWR
jgi:hypothetical protein